MKNWPMNLIIANVCNSCTFVTDKSDHADSVTLNNRPTNKNPLELSPVTEMDVLKEIFALKNKKSAGIDGISSYILKLCSFEIVKGITLIINRSIREGKVPTRWKIAKITPLFKKGDKANPDHYRPISLLPCVSKLLERVIQRQLVRYLLDNNILSKYQSGFRSKHSTSTALIKVTDEWLMALDNGMYTGSVFIGMYDICSGDNCSCDNCSDEGDNCSAIIAPRQKLRRYLLRRLLLRRQLLLR